MKSKKYVAWASIKREDNFFPISARLVNLVHIQPTDEVLDVACGYGNTAITARYRTAKVTGLDMTPKFLLMANEEENISGLSRIKWEEGIRVSPV